jgi:NADH:ubiquinone reductase (H+-translocating)
MQQQAAGPERPRVVIVGGGFGGLGAARALGGAPVDVTLVDRTNYHLFQPLLYQVAMAGLSPADIASPIRSIVWKQHNTRVLMAEVEDFDLAGRRVRLRDGELPYDLLIVAAGAETSYFGHDDWARFSLGMKDLDDALRIRQRVLLAMELAEREPDPELRRRLLTFVVIGGGPTGVELAGSLAELARFILARDFRVAREESARVLLLEAGPRILPMFPEKLSASAASQLSRLGVDVLTGRPVTLIDEDGVLIGDERLAAFVVLWAAGVRPARLAQKLGTPLARDGRVLVEPDLSLPGHPEVFVIGDMASVMQDGAQLPGLAPVAMQQGRHAGEAILRRLRGREPKPFRYRDKGQMATIGRSAAVAMMGSLRLSGLLAWLGWLLVHIVYLIGFRNRLIVLINWFWAYVTYQRGARLITGRPLEREAPELAAARQSEGEPVGLNPQVPPPR